MTYMPDKSKVYFIRTKESEPAESVKQKLERLVDASQILKNIRGAGSTAVKIHFGEEGNTGHIDPAYAGLICSKVSRVSRECFLSDTNTLYKGKRTNSAEHYQLACRHGFGPERTGAKLIIPDDNDPDATSLVETNTKLVKTAKIASAFARAEAMVSLAHFKGHMLTGFGGTIKNLGMGCATRSGKMAQHSNIAPYVVAQKCTGCSLCLNTCPAEAITMKNGISAINSSKCIGCAGCIAACRFEAIEIKWEDESTIQKIAEYALAALKGKQDRSAFLNFAVKITKECDCLAKDDPRITPDIGIFASCDPLAVDKAAYDTVKNTAGEDVFKSAHPWVKPEKQLEHAAKIGLGSQDYELIEIT